MAQKPRLTAGPAVRLSYDVAVVDPGQGVLAVTLDIEGLGRAPLLLGSSINAVVDKAPVSKFRVREAVTGEGDTRKVIRDGRLWEIPGGSERLQVRYEVFLNEGRPDGEFTDEVLSACDDRRARLLGSDVFLFPLDQVAGSIPVHYDLPEGWKLIHPFQSGEVSATYPQLESLYSSVVAAGDYRELERRVGDCEIVVAVAGKFAFDDEALIDVVAAMAGHQIGFFGESARPRYVFTVNPHPKSGDPQRYHYFGMHYDSSMLLLIDSDTDRNRLTEEPAQLCAHEFFHNWNGEILSQDGYEMNWFIEGVTTFYAYQSRIDAGLLTFPGYAEEMSHRYHEEFLPNPMRHQMSVAEAGTRVLQDRDVTRLLYSGGVLLAAALDQAIDEATSRRASLDDLMRSLIHRAQSDPEFRLTDQTLQEELNRITGKNFGEWLGRYVSGRQVPPLPHYITRT